MKWYHVTTVTWALMASSTGIAQPVYFADENLKAAVKEALGISHDPTGADMLTLRGLDAEGRGISDLTGLEHAIYLDTLDLSSNNIGNLQPLAGLWQINSLNLEHNRISDASPLAELGNLRWLVLKHNRVRDVSCLSDLTNLELLWLGYNNAIEDISPLSRLNQLRSFAAEDQHISDIAALANMAELESIDLNGNPITDIGPLAGKTNMTSLMLHGCVASDLSPLAGLRNLRLLWMGFGGQINDISPLAGLASLQTLHLQSNRISNISPISALTELTELVLDDNRISDIGAIAGMTKLRHLNLGDNQISRISALAGKTELEEVYLGGNQIREIEVLADMTKLRRLNLAGNRLQDERSVAISVLADMVNMTYLNLAGNQISNITALSQMSDLTEVELQWNRIADISPLAHLTNLSYLDLTGNSLNQHAYAMHIPQILQNNPGIELLADGFVLPTLPTLTVTATEGGIVRSPGVGQFQYDTPQVVPIEAVPDGWPYRFDGWTGSAVNHGKVADCRATETTVTVDGNYSLQANFRGLHDPWKTVYTEDFEGQVGPEWSHTQIDVTPIGARRFLGQFGNDTVTVVLEGLPAHGAVKLSFDLFIIRSWDGDGLPDHEGKVHGPDIWLVEISSGPSLLRTTFDNHHMPPHCDYHSQSYPSQYLDGRHPPQTGAAETSTLGFFHNRVDLFGEIGADAVYRPSFTFAHASSTLEVSFSAVGLQDIDDESWGLDNVRIELAQADAELPVVFRDWHLKTCVEAHLGVKNPTPTNMLHLTELTCIGAGIVDLTGLEYALNLTHLDLGGNQITDISVLQGLTALVVLDLTGNPLGLNAYSTYLPLLRVVNPSIEITYDLPLVAWLPEPANGAVGVVSPVLRWKAGRTAAYHDLYLAQTAPLGPRVLMGRLTTAEYTVPFSLIPGKTYYWRVDEVEADGTTIHEGEVWSFKMADPKLLVVSASPGGSVLTPGEGEFRIEGGMVLGIKAVPADADQTFLTWVGTAVEQGKLQDPNAPQTTVLVDGDYTLEAVFAEREEGPVLGFSLGAIEVDDPNEFYYRVTTNNTPQATFVQRVTGVEPDPNGMVQMQVVGAEPARAKARFGKCDADRILVQFQYLFETPDATEIVVYLSDVPELLAHNDPLRAEHYVEIGRVPAPPEGRPGSFGSGRFGTFEIWAFVGGLDLSNGTWVELELRGGPVQANSLRLAPRALWLASGGSGGSVVFDALSVQVHCSGYCLDLNFSKTVDSDDLLLVMAACGSTAELAESGEGSRYCLDGVFSSDGYVDIYDIYSLIWAMQDLSRVDCGSLCRVPLPLSGVAAGGPGGTGYSVAWFQSATRPMGIGPWPTELMILYKSPGTDRFCLFDAEAGYVTDLGMAGLPAHNATRIVRGVGDDLYVVSAEEGVLLVEDPVRCIIPPGQVRHGSATVYIGIQGHGADCFGRPILDVAFDERGHAYVVPVVVQRADREAYLAAARLELLAGQEPPYRVVGLYEDPRPSHDNRYYNHLREIELDKAGNVYIVNVHRLNENCILWKYSAFGVLLERLSLLSPDSPVRVENPMGLHVGDDGETLYLASGLQDRAHPDRAMLYGLSTQDFSLIRTITIEGMPFVTSITQDPATGTLWATGFHTTQEAGAFAWLPPEFTYRPLWARIPAGVGTAEAMDIPVPDEADLTVPASIIWTANE